MQSKDKKILMITYFFPPLGGIPPRRSFRFAKNLPAFGWNPVVLTVKNPSKREAAWDYEMLDELEKLPIGVIRTKWKDILWFSEILVRLKLFRLQNRFSAFCRRLPPDPYIGWYPSAVKEGLKVIKQNKIDVIYSNSAPFTAHLIGLKLQKATGRPWVADFRDPWIDGPLLPKHLFKWQQMFDAKLEEKVISCADQIITACQNYTAFLNKKYSHAKGEISTIYNGYDWSIKQNINEEYQNNPLEFVYAGAFYGPQSPVLFLRALESLMQKRYMPQNKIKFTIIGGHGDSSWKQEFNNSSVMNIVSNISFIPNNQVQEKLMKASCLLLYQARECKDLVIAGKTFEYISVGRPVLALVPRKTECLDILDKSGCLFKQAEPDSEEEIMEAILYVYENWRDKKLKVDPKWEYISQFDGKNLTRKLVEILNEKVDQ